METAGNTVSATDPFDEAIGCCMPISSLWTREASS